MEEPGDSQLAGGEQSTGVCLSSVGKAMFNIIVQDRTISRLLPGIKTSGGYL